MSIHKKIQNFQNINQKITSLNVLQDFMNTISEVTSVDEKIKELIELKEKYGFHVKEEMHTKHFLTDKDPYRKYNWNKETKLEILKAFTLAIADLDLTCINVII